MSAEIGEATGRRKKRSICYFLLSLLEDDAYRYVQWTNKKEGEFEIHWKHASSGAWVMNNDAETFRLWAKAKGKLKGREDNYKTWKANFRCAMKSRHELEEIPAPEGSQCRKNVKRWRFVDMDIVNRFEVEGERFDWNHSRTRPSSRRSARTTRTRQSNRDNNERTEPDESESPYRSFDGCEPESSLSQPSSSTTGLILIQKNEEALKSVHGEQSSINIEEDTDFNSYGAGLVQILEQDRETDRMVPNVLTESYPGNLLNEYNGGQTEITAFSQDDQLPSFHSLLRENPISGLEDVVFNDEWLLFGDQEYSKPLKEEEGIRSSCLDIPWSDIEDRDDPFMYESTYVQL